MDGWTPRSTKRCARNKKKAHRQKPSVRFRRRCLPSRYTCESDAMSIRRLALALFPRNISLMFKYDMDFLSKDRYRPDEKVRKVSYCVRNKRDSAIRENHEDRFNTKHCLCESTRMFGSSFQKIERVRLIRAASRIEAVCGRFARIPGLVFVLFFFSSRRWSARSALGF